MQEVCSDFCALVECGHVYGLCGAGHNPLALMLFANPIPIIQTSYDALGR